MSAVVLRRIEAGKNMARFYPLDVRPDLCSAAGASFGNGTYRATAG